MTTVKAMHKTSGRIIEVEMYTSFVYFVEEARTVSRIDFDEYYTIIK